jgi:hypothetical protein
VVSSTSMVRPLGQCFGAQIARSHEGALPLDDCARQYRDLCLRWVSFLATPVAHHGALSCRCDTTCAATRDTRAQGLINTYVNARIGLHVNAYVNARVDARGRRALVRATARREDHQQKCQCCFFHVFTRDERLLNREGFRAKCARRTAPNGRARIRRKAGRGDVCAAGAKTI